MVKKLLSEGEKETLAEIAHRLGRRALEDVAATAKPDTILGWYRQLLANKFDGSKFRRRVGRPKVDQETERLVVQMARENPSWGYDWIVGALANLGHRLSDQTVGNILFRRDIPPAPQRKKATNWKDFIRSHRDVLVGMGFVSFAWIAVSATHAASTRSAARPAGPQSRRALQESSTPPAR